MRTLRLMLAGAALITCGPVLAMPQYALSTDPSSSGTVFDITGTLSSQYPPPASSTLSGTLTLNTATGVLEAVDVTFTSPSTGISTVPPLTLLGPETAGGPSGGHFYEIELCAAADCSSNWNMELGLYVKPDSPPSLIGYDGGALTSLALWYGTPSAASLWGQCASDCGSLATKAAPGGGSTGGGGTGVPEPGNPALLLLGLGALGLTTARARRRR
jgi:hypothetical protein